MTVLPAGDAIPVGQALNLANSVIQSTGPGELEVESRSLGTSMIAHLAVPPGELRIAPGSNDGAAAEAEFRLVLAFGNAIFRGDDRSYGMKPGDMLLIDLSNAITVSAPGPTTWLTLSIARSEICHRMAGIDRAPPIHMPREGALASIYRSCLISIWRNPDDLQTPKGQGLGDHLLDLLMQAVVEAAEASPDPGMARIARLLLISSEIQAELSDPKFDGLALAARMGVPEAELRLILGKIRPRDLILQARLDKARRIVRSGVGLSMFEVAYRVGFRNASHFSERYAREHGAPPSGRRSGGKAGL